MPESDTAQAVIDANLAFYRAFESLLLDQMERVWDQDASVTCVHPGWTMLRGRDAVMESWGRIFDNTGMMHFAITDAEARVEGEWAWVTCTENLTSLVGGNVAEATVQSTNIFRIRDDGWLLVHHHGSPVM